MGNYRAFIQEIKDPEFGGFNAIEYADGGQEVYLSFKALLKWIGANINLYSNEEEVIKIDWESNKPMFMYSTSVSCNLQTCYIQNAYLDTTPGTIKAATGIGTFRPIDLFDNDTDSKYAELLFAARKDANVVTDPSLYPTVGNINNIYINIALLSQQTRASKESKGDTKISIREYLQNVCNEVNKALGSINDLQVVSDVDTGVETLTIVDYQQKRVRGLVKDTNITTIKAQGLGSMLTNIQAQSSITPEIATMISVGAQAQGNAVGVEATSFSRLSAGLKDRVYPTKGIGEDGKQGKQQPNPLEDRFSGALRSYMELVGNQVPTLGDTFGPVSLESTDKSDIENIAVEFYKSALAKFTETGQTSTAFIPIKLDFSLYGISGIKIFQKFKLSNDVLPISYKGDFDFIVTGVSHTVDNSAWSTSISSLISIKDQKLDKDAGTHIPVTIPIIDPSNYLVNRITKQKIGTVETTNGEVPDSLMKELPSILTTKYKGNTLTSDGGKVRLLTPIMRNLEKMLVVYERDNPGVSLKINSAYRTYPDQVRVRNEWEAKGDQNSAAYPGTSNHGFGRAVDFANGNGARLTPSMQQYKWLKANAALYGFKLIDSVKKGRTEAWEAWHWQDTRPFTDQDFK